MHRRTLSPVVLLALLAIFPLAGCHREAQGPPPGDPPEVSVITVEPQSVLLTSELPGRTAGFLVADIRPQVNGLLQKRFFTEGADVKKGGLLYQIDPAPYQAAYDSAVATAASATQNAEQAKAALEASIAGLKKFESILKLATTNRDRKQKLVKTDAVSAMEFDQANADVEVADAALKVAQAEVESHREAVKAAEAAIEQAKAAVETARINLDYTKINAPITGRIGRSEVTEGAIVTAYQTTPLATIQQFDPIYVDVPQSTAELTRLRQKMSRGSLKDIGTDKVKILLEDGSAFPIEGALKFRDVTVDPTTGSIIVRIEVPNPDRILLPGMFVRAVVEEGVNEQAILVPQQAVHRDPKGNPTALVVDAEGKVEQRALVTDRALGDKWLISSGLDAGDQVIVEGSQKARPNTAVKAIPFVPQSAATADAADTAQATL